MRILLAIGKENTHVHLVRMLKAAGHEVIPTTATGEELLATAERASRLHAALLSQAALGRGWPKLLRQLRRQAPSLPAVVLLGPGAEHAWRRAILAGAFEALPESLPEEGVVRALSRALTYSMGKASATPPLSLWADCAVDGPTSPVPEPDMATSAAR